MMAEENDSFEKALTLAMTLPYVNVNREKFLKSTLSKQYSDQKVQIAIAQTPEEAGISLDTLDKLANNAIKYETTKVTSVSALAGLPGGLAMVGTIPADTVQYLGHLLRVAQKLAYIYGWDQFISDEGMDDDMRNTMTIFIGVMFGIETANAAIHQIARVAAAGAAKKIANKALTKGWLYPIVKKVAGLLSVRMTKDIFAKSVSKAIPFLGALTSGTLTYVTYKPMATKLKSKLSAVLREKEMIDDEIIDIVEFDVEDVEDMTEFVEEEEN